MKLIAGFILLLLVTFSYAGNVKAEPIDETVSNIVVPGNILWGVQGQYQGYILYSVKEEAGQYVAIIARDGEPHQYPVITMRFTKDWDLISQSGFTSPQKVAPTPTPTPPEPVAPSQNVEPPVTPEPIPQRPTPQKPEKPDKPEKPEESEPLPEPPPVVPPKPEEPPEEPPTPEEERESE